MRLFSLILVALSIDRIHSQLVCGKGLYQSDEGFRPIHLLTDSKSCVLTFASDYEFDDETYDCAIIMTREIGSHYPRKNSSTSKAFEFVCFENGCNTKFRSFLAPLKREHPRLWKKCGERFATDQMGVSLKKVPKNYNIRCGKKKVARKNNASPWMQLITMKNQLACHITFSSNCKASLGVVDEDKGVDMLSANDCENHDEDHIRCRCLDYDSCNTDVEYWLEKAKKVKKPNVKLNRCTVGDLPKGYQKLPAGAYVYGKQPTTTASSTATPTTSTTTVESTTTTSTTETTTTPTTTTTTTEEPTTTTPTTTTTSSTTTKTTTTPTTTTTTEEPMTTTPTTTTTSSTTTETTTTSTTTESTSASPPTTTSTETTTTSTTESTTSSTESSTTSTTEIPSTTTTEETTTSSSTTEIPTTTTETTTTSTTTEIETTPTTTSSSTIVTTTTMETTTEATTTTEEPDVAMRVSTTFLIALIFANQM